MGDFTVLTSRETAKLLGISEETLRQMRRRKSGPPCRKLGSRCVYSLDEIQAWWKSLPMRGAADQPEGEGR